MGNRNLGSPAVIGIMLAFDALAGVVLAVLIGPVIGAIAFVVSATISLLSSRAIRAGSSSDNPYARED